MLLSTRKIFNRWNYRRAFRRSDIVHPEKSDGNQKGTRTPERDRSDVRHDELEMSEKINISGEPRAVMSAKIDPGPWNCR